MELIETTNDINFSVLIPVYAKENATYFDKAVESVIKQTLLPNEIIIVKDGPLNTDLENIIEKYVNQYQDLFKIISLEKNVGQGLARTEGIKKSSNNYIALMDSDDIALPNRFEVQINYLKTHPEVDCLGAYITEFEDDENKPHCTKILPKTHDEIFNFGKWRCPMSTMTIILKKDKVLSLNLNNKYTFGEDWFLFSKMLMAGMTFYNIPQVLVNARGGSKMLAKRVGFNRILQETRLFISFYKMGYINIYQCLRNIILKFLLRIIPTYFRSLIYQKFLRKAI